MFFIIYFWIKNLNIFLIKQLLTWMYFGLLLVVVDTFWLSVGGGACYISGYILAGGGWWWIYFGWWWVVVDIFWLVVGGDGDGWWHSLAYPIFLYTGATIFVKIFLIFRYFISWIALENSVSEHSRSFCLH